MAILLTIEMRQARTGEHMPTIEVIKASEAPPAPKKVPQATAEFLAALNSLKKDEVLRLTPDEGKSMRGLKTSVGRMSSSAKVKVNSWEGDDGNLYVQKA
jgi:hypothetical protein